MKPAWIVSGLLFLGVAAFLLKFLIAPAPVEEHRTQPVGWVEDFPEGVTPLTGMRVIVVRKSDSIYLLVDIDRYSGCGVEWRKAERLFYDPCGPSRYDEDGDPLPGSAAHLPLWRPEIQMEPGGRLVMDRSWLMSLPSANVRPLNGNSPVWNQLFNTSRLTDDIGVRSLVPFVVSFSPILPEHTD